MIGTLGSKSFNFSYKLCLHTYIPRVYILVLKKWFQKQKKKKKVEIQIVNQSSLLNTLEFVDLSTPEFVE